MNDHVGQKRVADLLAKTLELSTATLCFQAISFPGCGEALA